MCEWGTTVEIPDLLVPARMSHTGEAYRRTWKIDSCIAPIVRALNEGGIDTVGSCCGHGKTDGWIVLGDGRWLRIGVVPPDQFKAGIGGFISERRGHG